MKTKPWYKTKWGILLAILFLPLFILYYAWIESKWNKAIKIVATIFALFLMLFYIPPTEETQDEQVNQTIEEPATAEVQGETTEAYPISTNGNGDALFDTTQIANKTLYSVTEIVDGDTIKVNSAGETITLRLIGIDTPETKDPRKEVQCFGAEATDRAKELLEGKQIYLVADDTQDDIDKYDRLLRYVVRDDGYFFNLNMIRDGYANEYTYQTAYKFQNEFKAAEAAAREESSGLFGDACACEKTEETRECISCNTAKISQQQWDCSTSERTEEDLGCGYLCEATPEPQVSTPAPAPEPAPTPTQPAYTCDCSKACGAISSCDEAYFQLNQCGCSVRDGDNDGVPCEDLCPGG